MRRVRQCLLVPFDFSLAARAALTEAVRMARVRRAELVIFHVFAERKSPSEYGWRGGNEQRERDRCRVHELLEREAEEARSVQALARVSTAVGDPTERILEAIALEQPNAVLIGADEHRTFAGAFLGRVALRVVRDAKAPVFVVRRAAAPSPTARIPDRRIIVGLDFTASALAALEMAVTLAKSEGAEIRIVHAIPSKHSMDAREIADLRSRLEAIATDVAARGVTATATLTVGDPATTLVSETEGDPTAVIAIGARNRSRLSKILVGDVTESVLRQTDATVMVAHAGPSSIPLVALPVIGHLPA